MHNKLFIMFTSIVLLSCNNTVDETVQEHSIKFIETIQPTTISPPLINNASESHIVSQVHDALLRVNTTSLEVDGELCKRWVLNTNQDQYIFHLRKDVYFHDDTCFKSLKDRILSAYDVKKSFENLIQKRSQRNFSLGLLEQVKGVLDFVDGKVDEIDGISVRDSFSIEFNLVKPNAKFHYALVNPYMAIMPKKGLELYGEKCNIGCGPFKLSYTSKDLDSVVLERNELYYKTDSSGKRLPNVDQIVVLVEKVPQKSLRMLQDGKIDFILSMHQDHVKVFVERNIELFQGKKPILVLEQAEGLEESNVFLLRNAQVSGIQFNQANQLYLDRVFVKDSGNLE